MKTTEHIVPGGSVGEDSVPRGVELEDLRGKNLAGKSSAAADIVKRLAVLEASLRRCTWQGEAAGVGELRRAVRAVRALAESAAIAFADRDRQVKEVCGEEGLVCYVRACVWYVQASEWYVRIDQ